MEDCNPIQWITTQEAAELTGYSAEYIRRLLRLGRLERKKWGNQWMVSREALLEYKAQMEDLGNARFSPWRDDLEDQGRGRKQDIETGVE